jgi:hypothetical protein
VDACPHGGAKLRQFRTERKERMEKSPAIAGTPPHAADPQAVRRKPAVAALADDGDLG